ncbi:hypothetical protein CUC08_Gglean010019 [Alternaria sp. MG1]|nr:hypothetical protein CUC08_Gglean010019 [Alternaria sp. MG1]
MYHLYGTHQLVSKLVKESPEKAVDILTRCCADSKVLEEINAYLLQPKPTQREVPALLPGGLDITFGSPASPSVDSSRHAGSPLPRQRLARRPSSYSTTYPLSPPRSASSVTSHSTRNEISMGEYILLLLFGGTEVEEHLVRMRLAQTRYSVIRGDVVQKRGLDTMCTLVQPDFNEVYVPSRTAAGFDLVPTSCSIELTWRRPRSDSTHNTIFYVVPQEALDTDLLLGCEDSGEGIPGAYIHIHYGQGRSFG